MKTDGFTLRELVAPFVFAMIPFFPIVRQPDLGTAMVLFLIAASTALFVKIEKSSLLILVLAAVGIVVNNAMISGEVNGTIEANERIDVFPPGQVIGDIQAPVISIETGAVFNGICGMKSASVIPEKEPIPDAAK